MTNNNRLHESMNSIKPTEAAKGRMLNNILAEVSPTATMERRRPVNRSFVRRPAFAAIIAAVALISATVGVAASGVNPLNALHAFLGGGAENEGFNVGVSDMANGVEINLISAVADEQYVYAFVTVKDTTADRLGEDLTWGDISGKHERLFGGKVSGNGVTTLGYDTVEKTASAVIRLEGDGFSAGDKISFNISSISSNFRTVTANLNMRELALAPVEGTTAYAEEINGYGRRDDSAYASLELSDYQAMPTLPKDGQNIGIIGVDWGVITGIGYIDGKLHIQTKMTEPYRDYRAWFELRDADGGLIEEAYSVFFGSTQTTLASNTSVSTAGGYDEWVYEISPDELNGCYITAGKTFAGSAIDGDWNLTFTVESAMKGRAVTLQSENAIEGEMSVNFTPITTIITHKVNGTDAVSEDVETALQAHRDMYDAESYLILRDGSRVDLRIQNGSFDTGKNMVKYTFANLYYNTAELAAISLNGSVYPIEP